MSRNQPTNLSAVPSGIPSTMQPNLPLDQSHQLRNGKGYGEPSNASTPTAVFTTEEKVKSGRDLSPEKFPKYRDGDFDKFIKSWSAMASLLGPISDKEALYLLAKAFSNELQPHIMHSVNGIFGEKPDFPAFLEFLYEMFGVREKIKTPKDELRDVIDGYRKRHFKLGQYLTLFKMVCNQFKNRLETREAIDLLLQGLDARLARRVERDLTGPEEPTLERTFMAIDRFTIDRSGARHEGLVFEEEGFNPNSGNRMNPTRPMQQNESRKAFDPVQSTNFVRSRMQGTQNRDGNGYKRDRCPACGTNGHSLAGCRELDKAIVDKLLYKNERGRFCVTITGQEVKGSPDQSWIAYAKSLSSTKSVNHLGLVETETAAEVMANTIQKTPTMELREKVEREIGEKIRESTVEVPIKMLLEHPGIFYALRNHKTNAQSRPFVAHVNSRTNQSPGIDQSDCRYVNAAINNITVKALLDSGAEVNIISDVNLDKLGLRDRVQKVHSSVLAANEAPMKLAGRISGVQTTVGGKTCPLVLYVINKFKHDLILGRPFEDTFGTRNTNLDKNHGFEILGDDGNWEKVEVILGNKERVKSASITCVHLHQDGKSDTMEHLKNDSNNIMVASVKIQNKMHLLANVREQRFNQNQTDLVVEGVINTLRKRVADKIKPVSTQLPEGGRLFQGTQEKVIKTVKPFTMEEERKLLIGPDLHECERTLFIRELEKVRGALAFEMKELGHLNPAIEMPVIMRTVEHTPWELKPMRMSEEMRSALMKLLRERMKLGLLEYGNGSYSNRYFLVKKKSGEWRFIMDVRPLNAVTIRDANLPPIIEEILERLSGFPMYSTMDALSGYDQIPLAEESRDMTAIWTPIGLLRSTCLPQGWTNSVAVFERLLSRVLGNLKGDCVENMIDDLVVSGTSRVKNVQVLENGCRAYVWDLIVNTCKVLERFQDSGLVVSVAKSCFGFSQVELLGMMVGEAGHWPSERRLNKIKNWKIPAKVSELRGFLGLANGLHSYIPMMGELVGPLSQLLKGRGLKSSDKIAIDGNSRNAFENMKTAMSKYVTLSPTKLEEEEEYVLYTDAGEFAAGAVLVKRNKKTNQELPVKFESQVFNDSQKHYSVPRRETLAVLFGLKKLRRFLVNQKFVIRSDSRTTVAYMRNPNGIPDILITKWIVYSQLYDFEIEFIPREKNYLADSMTRLGRYFERESQETLNDHVDEILNRRILSIQEWVPPENFESFEKMHKNIIRYLMQGTLPDGLSKSGEKTFRKVCSKFFWDGDLWYREMDGVNRKVVDNQELRDTILADAHEESAHRGSKALYFLLQKKFYWTHMQQDTKNFVRECRQCQMYTRTKYETQWGARPVRGVMQEVAIDHLILGPNQKKLQLLVGRCTFSGWVEAVLVPNTKSEYVVDFLRTEIFARHGVVQTILADSGSVSSKMVKEFVNSVGAKLQVTLPQNPRGNSVVERGHKPIIDAASKLSHEDSKLWPIWIPNILWADRICVRESTGFTPFFLVYGREALFNFDIKYQSWMAKPLSNIPMSMSELLDFRLQQLNNAAEASQEAKDVLELNRSKARNAQKIKKIERGEVGDLVLVHEGKFDNSFTGKLEQRWNGPFRIIERDSIKAHLSDLNGTPFKRPIRLDRIKKFFLPRELRSRNAASINSIQCMHKACAIPIFQENSKAILEQKSLKETDSRLIQEQNKFSFQKQISLSSNFLFFRNFHFLQTFSNFFFSNQNFFLFSFRFLSDPTSPLHAMPPFESLPSIHFLDCTDDDLEDLIQEQGLPLPKLDIARNETIPEFSMENNLTGVLNVAPQTVLVIAYSLPFIPCHIREQFATTPPASSGTTGEKMLRLSLQAAREQTNPTEISDEELAKKIEMYAHERRPIRSTATIRSFPLFLKFYLETVVAVFQTFQWSLSDISDLEFLKRVDYALRIDIAYRKERSRMTKGKILGVDYTGCYLPNCRGDQEAWYVPEWVEESEFKRGKGEGRARTRVATKTAELAMETGEETPMDVDPISVNQEEPNPFENDHPMEENNNVVPENVSTSTAPSNATPAATIPSNLHATPVLPIQPSQEDPVVRNLFRTPPARIRSSNPLFGPRSRTPARPQENVYVDVPIPMNPVSFADENRPIENSLESELERSVNRLIITPRREIKKHVRFDSLPDGDFEITEDTSVLTNQGNTQGGRLKTRWSRMKQALNLSESGSGGV